MVRTRCDNQGAIQIFAGLVKCADCGYALSYTQSGGKRYQCSQYNVKGKNYYTSHHIRYDELYDAVLHDIRRRARVAAGMDKQMVRMLKREANGLLGQRLKQAGKDFKAIDGRMVELDTIISKLYEDSALNRLSPDRFDTLLQKYEAEQTELKKRHLEVQRDLAEQQRRQSESDQFMEMIAAYQDITALNASILNELVHSIEVGAIHMVDGVKHRSIRIKYRQYCYVELFGQDELYSAWEETAQGEQQDNRKLAEPVA